MMNEYHKINSLFKRDERGNFIAGQWSMPEFEFLKNNKWIFTEKVDGTNIRVIWKPLENSITFGGKTDNAQIPANLVTRLNNIFLPQRDRFMEKWSDCDVCFYGEGYGAKIQKGGGNYIANGVDFVLFDVKIGNFWLLRDSLEEIAKFFCLEIVPIVGHGTLEEAIEYARKPQQSMWGKFNSEGIVLRPEVELRTRKNERIISKLKLKDFEEKP